MKFSFKLPSPITEFKSENKNVREKFMFNSTLDLHI